jgi:tight adherence protein C
LRNLAARCDVDSIRSFSTLMIQSDALGSSVGRTLRVYAGEMRANRSLAAEEKAARIPVLLTIPLVACILPVIATALLLPSVLMMEDIFK